MKMISDREFRNHPGKIRKELEEQDVIMTSRGKPYAVLLPVRDQSEVEQVLELASRIRAQMALSSVRGKAAESGLNDIPDSELEEEIEHVRKQRRE